MIRFEIKASFCIGGGIMVLRDKDVVINITSEKQENRIRKILQPTNNEMESAEFQKRVTKVATGFVSARKGMDNIRKLLG